MPSILLLLLLNLVFIGSLDAFVPLTNFQPSRSIPSNVPRIASTELNALGFLRRFFPKRTQENKRKDTKKIKITEETEVCIIGGGVSGLAAALTASKALKNKGDKVILLESDDKKFGGRVYTDKTEDNFLLDRGFAVFIEQYPTAKKLLDYEELKLGKFLPGALVKLRGRTNLAKVCDPLRQPETLIDALLAPVGSLFDKIALLPLILNVRTKTVEQLFEESETDTLSELQDRWGVSDNLLDRFFKPFLEGIFLAPLDQQSSRMFSFVFKMFSEGAATLPANGIGAIAEQLTKKASIGGADLRLGQNVTALTSCEDGCLIEVQGGSSVIKAKSVIVATNGVVAQKLLACIEGFESLESLPEQPQRSVGNLYYGFKGEAPVTDPILVLSGFCEERGSVEHPVNNICFPSVVNPSYAPPGYSLCSVTVLESAMNAFDGDEVALDEAVRKELGQWFPERRLEIMEQWDLKGIYNIKNAQPSQLKGPMPANVNDVRPCSVFRGKDLPRGVLVCGDHMSTATLDGALKSGIAAGMAATQS